jgi:choline-sulfatase
MPRPSAKGKPNVLLIMTDQHRWDLMTCASDSPVPTPNIDRLASQGIRFTNTYCPYPVCVGSRMAMLTGLYAHNNATINNGDYLDWRYRTMAHHFAESGYLSALIGKMHFGDASKHGFAHYLSVNDWLMYLGPKARHYANEVANNPHSDWFFKSVFDTGTSFPDIDHVWPDEQSPWAGNVQRFDYDAMDTMASALAAEDHLDTFIARESLRFLDRFADQDQPFLLVASFMKPHTPLYAPEVWAAKYPIDEMPVPDEASIEGYPEHLARRMRNTMRHDPRRWQCQLAGYYACLDYADHCVGMLLDGLSSRGLDDETLVVYTSDHGEMLGAHGLQGKFCMFDQSVKVPLIFRRPQHVPAGVTCDGLTQLLDLYPTLAELTDTLPLGRASLVEGFRDDLQLDARSFAAQVLDPTAPGRDAVFSEHALKSEVANYMIRTDRYKYVLNDGGTCDELYDLIEDPDELRNLIDDPALAETARELRSRLVAWYDPADNPWRPGT